MAACCSSGASSLVSVGACGGGGTGRPMRFATATASATLISSPLAPSGCSRHACERARERLHTAPRRDPWATLQAACIRCDAMRCDAMRCSAVRCGAVRCGAVRCGAGACLQAVGAPQRALLLSVGDARHLVPTVEVPATASI
jgi:hypothetical protein